MSKKEKIVIASCPVCNRKDHVGYLRGKGMKKYFCADCCVEFSTEKGIIISAYSIAENGTTMPLEI